MNEIERRFGINESKGSADRFIMPLIDIEKHPIYLEPVIKRKPH